MNTRLKRVAIKVQKIRSKASLVSRFKHAARLSPCEGVDPARTWMNRVAIGDGLKPQELEEKILEIAKATKLRKNSVRCHEYYVQVPKGFAEAMDPKRRNALENDVEEWARLYVRGRILYMVWHADEQAVHAHIFAVPVLPEPKPTSPTVDGDAAGSPAALPTRAKSWGNLASSKILTREYLWRLHDTFQEEVGSHYGLARAIKGSRATPYELRAHAVEVKKQMPELGRYSVDAAKLPDPPLFPGKKAKDDYKHTLIELIIEQLLKGPLKTMHAHAAHNALLRQQLAETHATIEGKDVYIGQMERIHEQAQNEAKGRSEALEQENVALKAQIGDKPADVDLLRIAGLSVPRLDQVAHSVEGEAYAVSDLGRVSVLQQGQPETVTGLTVLTRLAGMSFETAAQLVAVKMGLSALSALMRDPQWAELPPVTLPVPHSASAMLTQRNLLRLGHSKSSDDSELNKIMYTDTATNLVIGKRDGQGITRGWLAFRNEVLVQDFPPGCGAAWCGEGNGPLVVHGRLSGWLRCARDEPGMHILATPELDWSVLRDMGADRRGVQLEGFGEEEVPEIKERVAQELGVEATVHKPAIAKEVPPSPTVDPADAGTVLPTITLQFRPPANDEPDDLAGGAELEIA